MRTGKQTALGLSMFVTLALLGRAVAAATLEDLQRQAAEWTARASEVYRFDQQALQLIWQAYCGELDAEENEPNNKDFATEIGLNLQHQEADKVGDLSGSLKDVRELADEVAQDPANADAVKQVTDALDKEERRLKALDDGAVLQGANHPFVQFAVNYGIQRHKELCRDYAGVVSVCDQEFPTLPGRRPDLVAVNGDGLWVYEFKPKNDKAIAAGKKQLEDYAPAVLKYYQQFFPQGRHGGFNGTPEGALGGEAMLRALEAEDDAWESGDTQLKIHPYLIDYEPCEMKLLER